MKNNISIRNIGLSAIDIQTTKGNVYIDAFNTISTSPAVKDGDIIVVTHDDGDHFDPLRLPDIKGREITIVGPATIVKPILELGKATIEQIKVMMTHNNEEPDSLEINNVNIKCYHTEHFVSWHSIHNSYILTINNVNIYITGDSYLTPDLHPSIDDIDVVICNLVDFGYITGAEDKTYAPHHHLSYMLHILSAYSPKLLIGVHLIDFDGTVSPTIMKSLVTTNGFDEIIIPESSDQVINLSELR